MAWIKMNTDLATNPKVMAIADELGIDDLMVVGCLYMVWSWADTHTPDGNAPCVTAKRIDKLTGVTHFAKAMLNVGWLAETKDGISIPGFEENNGESAKKRAQTAKRVAKSKQKSNAKVTQDALPREEKNREEKSTLLTEGTPQTPLGDCADSSPFGNGIGSGMAELETVSNEIRSLQESWSGHLSEREKYQLQRELKLFKNYPFGLVRDWMKSGPDKPKTNRYDFIESGGVSEKGRALEWAKDSKKVAAPTAF